MRASRRIVLIGGTSHTGKSTLARALAERLGGDVQSTDRLARHPGRPWAPPRFEVRPHVAAHYRELTDAERLASVLHHYRSMRPLIENVIFEHLRDAAAAPLVLEGSALLPETVCALAAPQSAVWLTADDGLLRARIETESAYGQANAASRALIEAFIERTHRFNRFVISELDRLDLPRLHIETDREISELVATCLGLTSGPLSD